MEKKTNGFDNLNAVRTGSYEYDFNTRLIFASESLTYALGLESGKDKYTIEEFTANIEDKEKYLKEFRCLLLDRKSRELEFHVKMLDKTTRVYIEHSHIITDNMSKPIKILGCIQEETFLHDVERRMEFERDRFWNYLNLVGSIILTLDLKGRVIFINKKGCEVLKLEENEIIGKDWIADFLPEPNREEVKGIRDNILTFKQNERDYQEGPVVAGDGEIRWISWSNTALYDENNEVVGTLSSGEDITELKNNEMVLKDSENRLKDSEAMSQTGHWVRDLRTGNYIFSDEMYRIFGLSKNIQLITAELLHERFHPDDAKRIIDYSENSLENGKDYTFEGRLLLPENLIKYIRASVKINKDSSGMPISSKGVISDVTETVLYEKELLQNEMQLKKAEEIAQVGNWVQDLITNEYICSDGFYRICGLEKGINDREKIMDVTHPEDRGFIERIISKSQKDGSDYEFENRIIRPNGEIRYVRSKGTYIKDERGISVKSMGTLLDITEYKENEKRYILAQQRLDLAEQIGHIGHWERNFKNDSMYWSDEIFRIIGYEPGSIEVVPNKDKDFIHPEDWDNLQRVYQTTRTEGKPFEIDVRAFKKDKTEIVIKIKGGISSGKGEPLVISGTIEDFTEIRRHYEEIEYMNYHDPLTGLFNRRYFDQAFSKIDNKGNYPISIIIADVNGLKMINDTLGHGEGDKILKKTADIIEKACDESDIVTRIGGDDFAILLPRTIKSQAETVINEIHRLILAENENMDLSVSMGLAVKFDSISKKEDIVKEAEDNMYTNKLYEKSSKRGDLLRLIMDTLYERSSREELHSERVSEYCEKLAKALGLPKHKINELSALGLLHDIGKIAVKDSVLNKTGSLDEDEWLEIRKHPETGYRLLGKAPGMQEASKYVLSHHERWDGKGYPRGLISYEIPLQARIIAIADAYDAMRSIRPYRNPLSIEIAANEIKKGAGSQFDPELAKVFIVEVLGLKW